MIHPKIVYACLSIWASLGGFDSTYFNSAYEQHGDVLFYGMSLIAGLEVGDAIRMSRERNRDIYYGEPPLALPPAPALTPKPQMCLNWMDSLIKPMPTTCPIGPAPFPIDVSPAFMQPTLNNIAQPVTCAAYERLVPALAPLPQMAICRNWMGSLAKPMPNTCPAGPAPSPIDVSPIWMHPSLFNVAIPMVCTVYERPSLVSTPSHLAQDLAQVDSTQNLTSHRPASSVAIFLPPTPFPLRLLCLYIVIALVVGLNITLWAFAVWLPAIQRLIHNELGFNFTFYNDGGLFPEATIDHVVLDALDMTFANCHEDIDHREITIPGIENLEQAILSSESNATEAVEPSEDIIIPGIDMNAASANSEAEDTQALFLVAGALLDVVLPPSSEALDTHSTGEDVLAFKIERFFRLILPEEEFDITSELFISEYRQEFNKHLDKLYPDPEVVLPPEVPSVRPLSTDVLSSDASDVQRLLLILTLLGAKLNTV